MIVSAKLKNIKISDQKVRPLIKVIKGMSLEKAIDILMFSNKKSAFFLYKLVKSVIANAEHNYGLNIDKLFIYEIFTNNGTNLKRFSVRAKGRSNKILKRYCHIFISIKERE
jgi:large subunit ribosomal protein L22